MRHWNHGSVYSLAEAECYNQKLNRGTRICHFGWAIIAFGCCLLLFLLFFFLTQILFLCTYELLVISCSRWIGSQTQFPCLFFTTTPQSALIQLNPYVYSVGKLLVLISLCSGRTSQHQLLTAGSLCRLRGRGRSWLQPPTWFLLRLWFIQRECTQYSKEFWLCVIFLIQVAAYLYTVMCSWMQLVFSLLMKGIKINAVC